ncbi:alpha-2,3-sialyltransferase, partial [Helicobacter valdiviensis]
MFKDFHDKYKCIFIHVPKVAGSSIERAIYQTDRWLVGHVKANDYVKFDREKFESLFSFGFVRNPYDRVVSAYHYLKNGGGTLGDEKWAKENICQYSSFEEFVEDLQDKITRCRVLNWMHFVPQYKFLCNEDKHILVNFIGKFEQIEDDFRKILNILHRRDTLMHVNKSEHLNYKDYYDSKTYKIIRDIYNDDFEIFDYDLEDQKIFGFSDKIFKSKLKNKIEHKMQYLEDLKMNSCLKIQALKQTIKDKDMLLNARAKQLNALQNNMTEKLNKNKEALVQKNSRIQALMQDIRAQNNQLSFQTRYGTAKARIQ